MAWTTRESKSRSCAWWGRGKHSLSRVEVNGGAERGWEWNVNEEGTGGAMERGSDELDVDRVCADLRIEPCEGGPGLGMSH